MNSPHPVDVYVGKKLRVRRVMLGLNQGELGDAIGVSFQQVQKYEHGTNRISVSKLWDMAKILEVPPSYFFEGIEDKSPCEAEGVSDKKSLKLLRAFNSIKDEEARRKIYELVINFASAAKLSH